MSFFMREIESRRVAAVLAVAVCALSVSGCARRLSQPDSPALARVDMLLAESAAESSAANRAVAEIESAVAARAAPAPAPVLPGQGVACPDGSRQAGVGCAPPRGSRSAGRSSRPYVARRDVVATADSTTGVAVAGRRAAEQEAYAANGRTLTDTDATAAGVALPPELRELASIDWDGPIEPAIRSLARHAGWGYATKGATPGTPVTVTLHRREQPLWTIVRDAGVLVTDRAAVVVDLTSKRFEVRYGR